MAVYLLHFDRPLAHARHYIGFTSRMPEERLEEHLSGNGSPLVRAAVAAGIKVTLVAVWPFGDRTWERYLKGYHKAARWCPWCNPGGKSCEERS